MYFNYFPKTMYDPAGDGSAKMVTDIMKRVRIRSNMRKEITTSKINFSEGSANGTNTQVSSNGSNNNGGSTGEADPSGEGAPASP